MTRKFIVSAAISADGYIARLDGGVEWLDRPDPDHHYGLAEFYDSIDTLVMGRKTYDFFEKFNQKPDRKKAHWVFSRTLTSGLAGVNFTSEDAKTFAQRLRGESGKDVWLMGGAENIALFLDAGEVDEIIVAVIPVLIGEGIPLIAPRHRNIELKLIESKTFEDGVVRLHYAVNR
jgi:dihydrofolate reductase